MSERFLRKWNYDTHRYDTHSVPSEWRVTVFETKMAQMINCAQCGSEIAFGESYTSLEIHNSCGFGYAVCDECYAKERERKQEAKEWDDA